MNKPLVTLIIFAYRAEKFIAETIDGALSQTYDNLEIIISDDCSPDGTAQVIKDKLKDYNGPHRVIVNINETNMGIVRHMNKLFSMATGEIIATNPGDDVSTPNRIADTVEFFEKDKTLKLVTFSHINIDENSSIIGENVIPTDKHFWLNEEYFSKPHFMTTGTAVAFKKEVLDIFGALSENAQTEDSPLRFRALLLGRALHSAKVGVRYRTHGDNISGKHNLMTRFNPQNIANQYQSDLNKAYEKNLIKSSIRKRLQHKLNYYVLSQVAIRQLYKRKFISRYALLIWYCLDWRITATTKFFFIRSVLSWTRTDLKHFIEQLSYK